MKMSLLSIVLSLAVLVTACVPAAISDAFTIKETVVVTKVVIRDVVVTATPQPPTSTPQPPLIFQDEFDEEDPGWTLRKTDSVTRFYQDGQYHILIKTAGTLGWSGHPELEIIDDFNLEVDITQVSGPDNNAFGVLFRYQNADNMYALMVSGDGYFKFWRQIDSEAVDITRWTRAPAIRQGQDTNHLRLVAEGSMYSAFVNGELLAIVPDNTFRRGDILLFASTIEEETHISFDNLVVTDPE